MMKFRLRFIIRDDNLGAQDLFDMLNRYKLKLELIEPNGPGTFGLNPEVIVTGNAHDVIAFKNAFDDGTFDFYHMAVMGKDE
jgi:hypothetical protein